MGLWCWARLKILYISALFINPSRLTSQAWTLNPDLCWDVCQLKAMQVFWCSVQESRQKHGIEQRGQNIFPQRLIILVPISTSLLFPSILHIIWRGKNNRSGHEKCSFQDIAWVFRDKYQQKDWCTYGITSQGFFSDELCSCRSSHGREMQLCSRILQNLCLQIRQAELKWPFILYAHTENSILQDNPSWVVFNPSRRLKRNQLGKKKKKKLGKKHPLG